MNLVTNQAIHPILGQFYPHHRLVDSIENYDKLTPVTNI
jgi:hypothetical protein